MSREAPSPPSPRLGLSPPALSNKMPRCLEATLLCSGRAEGLWPRARLGSSDFMQYWFCLFPSSHDPVLWHITDNSRTLAIFRVFAFPFIGHAFSQWAPIVEGLGRWREHLGVRETFVMGLGYYPNWNFSRPRETLV